MLHKVAIGGSGRIPRVYEYYADLADTYAFEERAEPTWGGAFGLLVREPVGVVGAIIPWSAPMSLIAYKLAPALLAGCTVVLKASPEAPGAAYLMAEIIESAGLPAGVVNVVTADREVSELLVRDPRVDKIGVEGYIATGIAEGAVLATGGGRPKHLDRGWFVEPTVFGNVDNSSTIAREEILGPVLSVIAADDEADAVNVANDTIYGLNASVFTNDLDRTRAVARQLRSGTVGHNAFRTDFGMAFGGFKQSGIGREGGREGLLPYLETKTVILDGVPQDYQTP